MEMLIVIYTHRHGVDAWPVSADTTEEKVIEGLEEWEPDRGETIELRGPFTRDAYTDVWSS